MGMIHCGGDRMHRRAITAAAGLALAVGVGCHHHTPAPENTGVQAKDVVAATDKFTRDLLSQPALNTSQTQWTIVLTDVENKTSDPSLSYEAFDSRLKSLLGRYGQGRVTLIENKAKFHQMQNQELEGPSLSDPFGQGAANGHPAGVQPDFDLVLTITDLPSGANDYYLITGRLLNLKTRVLAWNSPPYEFQAPR